jgi:hypothetical protein
MKVRYIASLACVYCLMSGCADTTSPHERSIDQLQEDAMRQVDGAEADAVRLDIDTGEPRGRKAP